MTTKRILILEDDLLTLSKLLTLLFKLEENLESHAITLAVTSLSEYTQVEDYVNTTATITFDAILLDRDCKAGGSFHCIDLVKHDSKKVIGISSVPLYNNELTERGVQRIVHKEYTNLDIITVQVQEHLAELLLK